MCTVHTSPVRAVLFDFYGTLTSAFTRGPGHRLVPRLLGCDPDEYFAVLDTSFYPRCRGTYGDAIDTMRWIATELGVRPGEGRLRAAQAARLTALRADTRLRRDSVPELWRLSRSGVKLAVISDCTWELPEIMQALPINPVLDSTVYSVHAGVTKPHPDMYLTACERLEVDPAECVYVGDGGSGELTGAQAVGIRAIRLAAPDLADHLVYGADNGFVGEAAGSLSDALTLAFAPPLAAEHPWTLVAA